MRVTRTWALGVALLGTLAAPTSVLAGPPDPKPPHIPDDGKGALTLGPMLLVAATGLGVGLMFDDSYYVYGLGGLAMGIASVGVGIGITVMGVERQRRYREWQSTSPLRPPARGNGLIVGGVATLIGSGGVIGLSVMGWASSSSTPWWGPTGVALGSAGVVASAILVGIGGPANVRFERWRKRRVRVLPTASFGPRGLQFGLTGRF